MKDTNFGILLFFERLDDVRSFSIMGCKFSVLSVEFRPTRFPSVASSSVALVKTSPFPEFPQPLAVYFATALRITVQHSTI
jgi:hypothetical protein